MANLHKLHTSFPELNFVSRTQLYSCHRNEKEAHRFQKLTQRLRKLLGQQSRYHWYLLPHSLCLSLIVFAAVVDSSVQAQTHLMVTASHLGLMLLPLEFLPLEILSGEPALSESMVELEPTRTTLSQEGLESSGQIFQCPISVVGSNSRKCSEHFSEDPSRIKYLLTTVVTTVALLCLSSFVLTLPLPSLPRI